MKYDTVGAFVRAKVIPRDMSVTAAARALGIGRQALHALLSGKSKLSTEMAAKLETAFGASSAKLLKRQADLDARDAAKERAIANASGYLRITAGDIEKWATENMRSAPASFPVLVRRLVHATTSDLTELDFHGDEEVERHGWDGEVVSRHGTGKVPEGRSSWELSTSTDLPRKPANDIKAREGSVSAAIRKETTFVFATPRSWPGKKVWAQRRRASGAWKDVRAYDADDLAQWLETSVATQIWFAEQIGRPADGIRTLDDCWSEWAEATDPNLSKRLFDGSKKQNSGIVEQWLQSTANKPLVVVADSIAEGLAYLAASLPEQIRNNSLVVSTPNALQRTSAATLDSVLIIDDAATERRAGPVFTTHRVIVVRLNTGIENEHDVLLTQVDSETFRAALGDMGLHEDVAYLAKQSARSPTILRRYLAISSELKQPEWADRDKQLSTKLIPILIAGAWTRSNKNDCDVVAALANVEYDKIERDLAELFSVADSPVWIIGNFCGIVCRRDALFAAHPCLLDKDLDRFFDWASLILSEDDPVLDLEPNKRWLAPICGEKREISGTLRNAIGEMLVLLAVHGDELSGLRLSNIDITSRVDETIQGLLEGKTTRELMALSSDFEYLAEASPDVFLRCIEEDLRSTDPQILPLLRPVEAGFMDGPDRTNLLWALESLAWGEQYYLRVIRILAKLSETPIHDNWINTPENSLESLISCWNPETTVRLEGRIEALRKIAEEFGDVGWRRCLDQVSLGYKTATPNHRPIYRDLGKRSEVPHGDLLELVDAAWDILLNWRALDSQKISDLINVTEGMQDRHKAKLVDIIATWQQNIGDIEKAKVVEALRESGYSSEIVLTEDATTYDESMKKLAEQLQPEDIISRYCWLFAEHFVHESRAEFLKENFDYREQEKRILAQRDASVEVIFRELGTDGILHLLDSGNASFAVGQHLANVLSKKEIRTVTLAFLSSKIGIEKVKIDDCIRGLLHGNSEGGAIRLARNIIEMLPGTEPSKSDSVLRLFLACPFDSKTWKTIAKYDERLAKKYWCEVNPSASWLSEREIEIMVDRLLEVDRPHAAFHGLECKFNRINAATLVRLMEAIVTKGNKEPSAYLLDAYRVDQALGHLHDKKALSVDQMARLEFFFAPLLNHSEHGLRNLERKIADNPASFVELVALKYKRKDGGDDPTRFSLPEGADHRGTLDSVFYALSKISLTPGTSVDGEINVDELINWIREAMKLLDEISRREIGEQCIGELLGRCPIGTDGVWPHEAVRHALEELGTEVLSKGMRLAVYNSRGVIHGALGDHERTLATKYQGWSDVLASEFLFTAQMLSNIATCYRQEGEWLDLRETVRQRLGDY